MRVAKVRPEGYAWMGFDADNEVEEILTTVKELLADLPTGDTIVVEVVEMDEEKFKNLPEFPGW